METSLQQASWQKRRLSSTDEMGLLIDTVVQSLTESGYPPKDIFGVRLAMEEAIVNSIKHAHRYDPSKEVEVRFRVGEEHFLAEVEDQGPGFNPADVCDPTAFDNLERPCGRGLLLMRHYTTWLRFNERGNCVTFCKYPSEPLCTW